jgi:hypothetical protein
MWCWIGFDSGQKKNRKGDRQFGKAAKSAAEPYYLYRGEYSQKIVTNPYI